MFAFFASSAVGGGWTDGGVGRCQTDTKQFGFPPPKGWLYDTQAGLSGSLSYDGTVSLKTCEALCATDLAQYGCREVSWGLPGDCYAAVECVNLVPWPDYHSYVLNGSPNPPPSPPPLG